MPTWPEGCKQELSGKGVLSETVFHAASHLTPHSCGPTIYDVRRLVRCPESRRRESPCCPSENQARTLPMQPEPDVQPPGSGWVRCPHVFEGNGCFRGNCIGQSFWPVQLEAGARERVSNCVIPAAAPLHVLHDIQTSSIRSAP